MEKAADQKFKELLSRLQKEILKAQGFKKNGSNFRQFLSDGTCKIINFQKSLYNSESECSFTLNLGLYFQKDPENPYLLFKEYECVVRTRVNGISDRYNRDQWWTITDTTDMEVLFSEFSMLMQEDILPWLDQFSCWRDVIRAGQTGALKGKTWGSIHVNI